MESGKSLESPADVIIVPAPETDQRSAADIPIEELFEDVDPGLNPLAPPVFPVPEAAGARTIAEAEDYRVKEGSRDPEEIEQGETIPDFVPETQSEDEEYAGEDEEPEPNDTAIRGDRRTAYTPVSYLPSAGPVSFNRQQWFDLFTWARHADSLTADQRMEIIRMGRLIQRGRKLTFKQDARIREMIELAQSHGYRIP
jgi:hypothetical protein